MDSLSSQPLIKQEKSQKPKHWNGHDALRIGFLAYVVSQVFVIIPILAFTAIYGQQATDMSFLNQPWVSLVLSGVSALGLLTTLLLFLRYRRISPKLLGLKKPQLKSLALVPGVYLVYLIALVAVVSLTGALFTDFNIDQAQDVGFADAAGWQLLLAFLGLVVIAPFAEELLFRGFIYKGLKYSSSSHLLIVFGLLIALLAGVFAGAMAGLVIALLTMMSVLVLPKDKKLSAALFTSMLFGLVHLQWNVAIDTFILSFALIWLVERTNNIWPAIALHALKNGIAFVGIFVLAID